eukprot:297557_1
MFIKINECRNERDKYINERNTYSTKISYFVYEKKHIEAAKKWLNKQTKRRNILRARYRRRRYWKLKKFNIHNINWNGTLSHQSEHVQKSHDNDKQIINNELDLSCCSNTLNRLTK